jgi:hypothetical protein
MVSDYVEFRKETLWLGDENTVFLAIGITEEQYAKDLVNYEDIL